MDLLEKLEMLEEAFEEENMEEEERTNCDIEQEASLKSVLNDEDETEETLESPEEAQNESSISPKEPTEDSFAASSELTKSLRKARPFKKSPTKVVSKDKAWETEDPASEGEQGDSLTQPRAQARSSPTPPFPRPGPTCLTSQMRRIFRSPTLTWMFLKEVTSPVTRSALRRSLSQLYVDHELSHLSPSKSSPTKLSRNRQTEVSPQILSVTDAVAAVAALQVGLDIDIKEDIKEDEDDVKMNGEAGSDGDTDNPIEYMSRLYIFPIC